MATPRPDVEWLFDDNGKMSFVGVYDFTSAEYDNRFVGAVLGLDGPISERVLDDGRLQIALTPEMARALGTALLEHAQRLA